MRHLQRSWWITTAGLMLLILPFLTKDESVVQLACIVFIWSIFALGFDLAFSSGLLSMGHAAFFGAGSFIFALATIRCGAPFVIALPAAGLGGGVLAWLMSVIALRLTGVYFAVITLAMGQLLYLLFANALKDFTGGRDGLPGVPRPDFFNVDFFDGRNFYWLLLAIFVCVVHSQILLRDSPWGQVIRGLKQNSMRLEQLGFNVNRQRRHVMFVSGVYSGIAGALLGSLLLFTSVDLLHWLVSGDVIIMTILGGFGTVAGPILGVAIFTLLKNYLSGVVSHWQGILGLFFVVCVILMPEGLHGLIRSTLANRRSGRS